MVTYIIVKTYQLKKCVEKIMCSSSLIYLSKRIVSMILYKSTEMYAIKICITNWYRRKRNTSEWMYEHVKQKWCAEIKFCCLIKSFFPAQNTNINLICAEEWRKINEKTNGFFHSFNELRRHLNAAGECAYVNSFVVIYATTIFFLLLLSGWYLKQCVVCVMGKICCFSGASFPLAHSWITLFDCREGHENKGNHGTHNVYCSCVVLWNWATTISIGSRFQTNNGVFLYVRMKE